MEHPSINPDSTLAAVKEQFETWRSARRSKKEPIPASLWREAVNLCEVHSITRVCRVLRLCYADLKKKMPNVEPAPASPAFMELAVGSVQWQLSCERCDGASLRISGSGGFSDFNQILGQFLS